MSKKQYCLHACIFSLGAGLLGFGVALYCIADLGADPLSTFALGLQMHFPLLVEEGIILISFAMMACTFFIKKSNIGLFSFAYPFISGIATKVGFLVVPVCEEITLRYVYLFCGILCMAIAIAITSKTRIGYNPYDGLAFALMEKFSWSYSKVRWFIDGSFLCIGVVLGAIFDSGTIIVLIIMGPCASACMRGIEQLLDKYKKKEATHEKSTYRIS